VAGEPEVLRSRTLADGTVIVESERASATLTRLDQGFVLFTCWGVLSDRFYAPMVAVAQREIVARGRLTLFVDGWELKSVDTRFREAWTEWFKPNRERFHMRLLLRTKLMEIAASLANRFTGLAVIQTYSSIPLWEAACTADFPPFRKVRSAVG
jgi:hypothetical protein